MPRVQHPTIPGHFRDISHTDEPVDAWVAAGWILVETEPAPEPEAPVVIDPDRATTFGDVDDEV